MINHIFSMTFHHHIIPALRLELDYPRKRLEENKGYNTHTHTHTYICHTKMVNLQLTRLKCGGFVEVIHFNNEDN